MGKCSFIDIAYQYAYYAYNNHINIIVVNLIMLYDSVWSSICGCMYFAVIFYFSYISHDILWCFVKPAFGSVYYFVTVLYSIIVYSDNQCSTTSCSWHRSWLRHYPIFCNHQLNLCCPALGHTWPTDWFKWPAEARKIVVCLCTLCLGLPDI